MVSAIERIEAIMKYGHCKSYAALARVLKLDSAQVFYDIQKGKTSSISAKLANKIILVFPDINMGWLLSGEGRMLQEKSTTTTMNFESEMMESFIKLVNTISSQQETIYILASKNAQNTN